MSNSSLPHGPRGLDALALAVDGGNSKTEIVIVRIPDLAGRAATPDAATPDAATPLTRIIAPGSGGGPADVVAVVFRALSDAGIESSAVTRALAAVAGVDFPGDEEAHRAALGGLLPNARVDVVNDAVAVLDAGAGVGHALAIVCGAGLNAVARGPRGVATVPALGWPSGDWGGGDEVGREAVRQAARAADGRGSRTVLVERILELTDLPNMDAVARAIRDGRITAAQVGAFAAVVTQAAAEGDAVAAGIVTRAVDEALSLADVVIRRAWGEAPASPPPAVLAGGLFADPLFRTGVEEGLRSRGFTPAPLAHRPVDGLVAALAAEVGAAPASSALAAEVGAAAAVSARAAAPATAPASPADPEPPTRPAPNPRPATASPATALPPALPTPTPPTPTLPTPTPPTPTPPTPTPTPTGKDRP